MTDLAWWQEDDEHGSSSLEAVLSFLDEFAADVGAANALLDNDEADRDGNISMPSEVQFDECMLFQTTDADLNYDCHPPIQHVSAEQPTLSKSQKLRKSTSSNSNRPRDEWRQELAYLRHKVHEMEQQLKKLKATKSNSDSSRFTSVADMSSCGSCSTNQVSYGSEHKQSTTTALSNQISVLSIWKDTAQRQHDLRIDAERENARLKVMLKMQLRVAKNLHSILKKRTISRALENFGMSGMSKRVHDSSPSHSDRVVYSELLSGVENCYTNIDAMFEASGLAEIEHSHNGAYMKEGDANRIYLETFITNVLPFDLHTTAAVVWQHFAHNKDGLPRSFYCRKDAKSPGSTDDMVLESFRVDIKNINCTTAEFNVKQVLRRFVEADRVVVVWTTMFEPFKFAHEPAWGYRFHGEGYVMIRKPRTIASDATILQTCCKLFPDFSEHDRSPASRMGALTDFVLNYVARNVSASHQLIENALLEQALRSSCSQIIDC